MKNKKYLWTVIGILASLILLIPLLFLVSWNYCFTAIFLLPSINYMQAFKFCIGLYLLENIINIFWRDVNIKN